MVLTNFDFNIDFTPLDRSLVSPMVQNSDKLIAESVKDIGELFLKLVRFYAPRKTGQYAKSWRVLEQTKNSVTIGTNLKTLFVVLEFGVDHDVRIDAKGDDGVLVWTDVSGVTHFAKFVVIPPRNAQPHLRKAIKDIKKIWQHVVFVNLGKLVLAFRDSTKSSIAKINELESKINRPN